MSAISRAASILRNAIKPGLDCTACPISLAASASPLARTIVDFFSCSALVTMKRARSASCCATCTIQGIRSADTNTCSCTPSFGQCSNWHAYACAITSPGTTLPAHTGDHTCLASTAAVYSRENVRLVIDTSSKMILKREPRSVKTLRISLETSSRWVSS